MEFSLVALMLVTLVLGLIDTSFVLDDTNRTRQVVRASARLIATDSPTRVPAVSSTTCGATAGTGSGSTERSLWAACRVVEHARALRLDTTRLSVLVTTGMVTDAGLTISGGGTNGDAIVVCVAYRTQSRTGLLSSLYGNRVLRSRMVVPADATVPLTPATTYNGTYGSTVDWTLCQTPTGTR